MVPSEPPSQPPRGRPRLHRLDRDIDPDPNPSGRGPRDDPPGAPRILGLSPGSLILALTALAAALRFSGLGRQSFWYDEAVSVVMARHGVMDLLLGRALDTGNPPLYPVLLHAWMAIFGSSDAAVRALSAVFGAATVPVVWRLGQRLLPDRVALLGATLLALSPFHLQMAQEARCYTLLTWLAVVTALLLLRATAPLGQGEVTPATTATAETPAVPWRTWLLWALGTAAMVLTHYFGAFVALAEIAFVVVVHRREKSVWRPAAVACAVAALPVLLWLPALAAQLRLDDNLSRSADSWSLHLLATPLVFTVGSALVWKDIAAGGLGLGVALRGLLALAGTVAMGLAAAVGAWRCYQRARADGDRNLLLLIALLIVPVLVPATISLVTPLYNTRYVIVASVPFLLFAAAGLYEWSERPRTIAGGVVIVAVAAATLSVLAVGPDVPALAGFTGRPTKHQWRQAAAFVEAARRPSDALLFDADHNETAYAHYAGPAAATDVRLRLHPAPGTAADNGDVAAIVGFSRGGRLYASRAVGAPVKDETAEILSHERVWLILSDPRPTTMAQTRAFFARWKPGAITSLRGITIQSFERPR